MFRSEEYTIVLTVFHYPTFFEAVERKDSSTPIIQEEQLRQWRPIEHAQTVKPLNCDRAQRARFSPLE